MATTAAQARASRAASSGNVNETVFALVAGDAERAQIARVAMREKLAFHAFASIEDMLSAEPDPSLIVMWVEDSDVSLPKAIESLTQRSDRAPIVVACPSIERWEMRAALAARAAGIVLHENLDTALGPCLRAVIAGQICVPRDHWRQIEPPALSAREKQILGLVVMGYMNSQIAEQLFLAESTVKSHLSSAFGKLGVRSRNEAVKLILDPDRGLGMGILSLGGEPLETRPLATQ
jgi:DNA-binding NarL/FixJ family response regulator